MSCEHILAARTVVCGVRKAYEAYHFTPSIHMERGYYSATTRLT